MKNRKESFICFALSAVIGLVVGVTAGFFGQLLHFAEEFRGEHYLYLLPFLGVVGVLLLFIYKHVSPNSEQGLNLAIAYNMGDVDNYGKIQSGNGEKKIGKYPKGYALLKLFTNFVMLFFGASTGKEGSFASFGASIGDYTSRIFKARKYSRTLLIAGVSAAVSGLFQTPIGGFFFALEFTAAGILSYFALIPALISSYVAFFFSKLCGYTAFYHPIVFELETNPKSVAVIILSSIIFGITGWLFSVLLHKSHVFYRSKVKNRYLGILISGTVTAIILILLHNGRYAGTGANIITDIFINSHFELYDFAVKFILTIVCITIGFSGGEMMPLLTIGASLGAAVSLVTGLPLHLCAAMGCAAVYSSATNTLIAPIFIGIEMFGTDAAVYIAISCIIAYAINRNQSVYTLQGKISKSIYSRIKK